ncbi:MAG: 3-dehydrosphinganine reductase [Halioglobus sp.]|jgi:3-dehydrosphinganine reductase
MPKQRVFITGGSSGIGLSLAKRYAQSGDDIILIARDQAKLDDAVSGCKTCAKSDHQTTVGVSLDLSNIEGLQNGVDKITKDHGQPDVLILCAGIAGNKTFLQMNSAEFDTMMAINFTASREMARCVLPAMLDNGRGQIVFISSMSGRMGIYGYSAYCASKFAVIGFVQALQQELYGTGVSVNLICPSEVATPMIAAEADTALPQTRLLKDLVGTLSPEKAADIIIRGIRKNKGLVITGFTATLFDFFNRVFPSIFRKTTRLIIWYASRKQQDEKNV